MASEERHVKKKDFAKIPKNKKKKFHEKLFCELLYAEVVNHGIE